MRMKENEKEQRYGLLRLGVIKNMPTPTKYCLPHIYSKYRLTLFNQNMSIIVPSTDHFFPYRSFATDVRRPSGSHDNITLDHCRATTDAHRRAFVLITGSITTLNRDKCLFSVALFAFDIEININPISNFVSMHYRSISGSEYEFVFFQRVLASEVFVYTD